MERLILQSLIKRYLFSYSVDTIYKYNVKFDNWTLLPQKLDMGLIPRLSNNILSAIIVGDDICDSTTTVTGAGTESTDCTPLEKDQDPGEFCTDQDSNFCRDSFTDTNEGMVYEKCTKGGLGECLCRKSCNDILNGGETGDKVGDGFCWLLGQ